MQVIYKIISDIFLPVGFGTETIQNININSDLQLRSHDIDSHNVDDDDFRYYLSYIDNPTHVDIFIKKRNNKRGRRRGHPSLSSVSSVIYSFFTTNPMRDSSHIPFQCQLCSQTKWFINKETHKGFGRCTSNIRQIRDYYSIITYLTTFTKTIHTENEIYDEYAIIAENIVECSTKLYIQCPVCLDENCTNPVIIECGHCLCRSCYTEIISISFNNKVMSSCPICRYRINNVIFS